MANRYHGHGAELLPDFSWSGTPSQRLRAKKRFEAEERNEQTPMIRTAEYRRVHAEAAHHAKSKGGGNRG